MEILPCCYNFSYFKWNLVCTDYFQCWNKVNLNVFEWYRRLVSFHMFKSLLTLTSTFNHGNRFMCNFFDFSNLIGKRTKIGHPISLFCLQFQITLHLDCLNVYSNKHWFDNCSACFLYGCKRMHPQALQTRGLHAILGLLTT